MRGINVPLLFISHDLCLYGVCDMIYVKVVRGWSTGSCTGSACSGTRQLSSTIEWSTPCATCRTAREGLGEGPCSFRTGESWHRHEERRSARWLALDWSHSTLTKRPTNHIISIHDVVIDNVMLWCNSAPNYASVMTLCEIGSPEALALVDRFVVWLRDYTMIVACGCKIFQ
jgi:hypothetical protein